MDAQLMDLGLKAVIGIGGMAAGFVGGWAGLFWKTRELRAEFEDLKKKRRLTGARAAEQAELMNKHAETFVKLKAAGATLDEFHAFVAQATKGRKAQRPEMTAPPKEQPSANVDFSDAIFVEVVDKEHAHKTLTYPGTTVLYQRDGSKWFGRTHSSGEEIFELAPRTTEEIARATQEVLDRLWYHQHRTLNDKIEGGEAERPSNWGEIGHQANRVAEFYGITEEWPWQQSTVDMLKGKLSALQWVGGNVWDYFEFIE